MQERETADLERQLERVRVVARKGSKVEVAGYSTGVINEPHPLLLLFFTYRLIAPPVPAFAVSAWRSAHLFQLPCDMMRRAAARARRTWKRVRAQLHDRLLSSRKHRAKLPDLVRVRVRLS